MRRTLRFAVPVAAIALVAAGTRASGLVGDGGGAGLRTANAATRNVSATLDAVGTVEPVTQAAVAFPVAGTVATVDVTVGAKVARGQTLATLDPHDLQAAVDQAQAAYDQANLTRQRALAGESTPSTGTGGTGSTGTSSGGFGATGAAASAGALVVVPAADVTDPALAKARQAVLDAQKDVDAKLADAQTALDSAALICQNVGTTAGDVSACQTALDAVLDAQTAVQASQKALNTAASALDDLLAQRASSPGSTTTTTPRSPTPPSTTPRAPSSGSGSGSGTRGGAGTGTGRTGTGGVQGSTGGQTGSGRGQGSASGSGGGGSTRAVTGTGSGPSAADLIADQAAVDAAAADLASAQQAVAQATIVSPVSGTVAAVGLTRGEAVTAGSSTANVVVVGAGGFEVTAIVAVDDLPHVKLGQTTTVVPDGRDTPLDGKVVAIGAPTTTNGVTTYPVTIGIDDHLELGNGTTASVTIVTDRARSAVAVPTSAVHVAGGRTTVAVPDGQGTKAVTVKVGAVGPTWTEITAGVEPGQAVVLADLGQPLPDSATA